MSFKDFFQVLKKCIMPYRRTVFWYTLLTISLSGMEVIFPLLAGKAIDQGIGLNFTLAFKIMLFWLVLRLIYNVLTQKVSFFGNTLGDKVAVNYVQESLSRYLTLPLGFHRNTQYGEQLKKIDRAGDFIAGTITDVLFDLMPSILTVLIVLGVMAYNSLILSFVVFLIIIAYALASFYKTKPIVRVQKKLNKAWNKVWGIIYDSVNNINTVKSAAGEKSESKRYGRHFKEALSHNYELYSRFRHLSYWTDSIQDVGYFLFFATLVFLLAQGRITVGLVFTFIMYIEIVFNPLREIQKNYRFLNRAWVAVEDDLELREEKTENLGEGKKIDVLGSVVYENVSFSYSNGNGASTKVLHDICFDIKVGEIVAFVGESGVGKSTLLNLLSRYFEIDKGRILVDGTDIKDMDRSHLRRQIALVPQEVLLFNDTIRFNLSFGMKDVSEYDMIKALKLANAWSFVSRQEKGIDTDIGEKGLKLSTGQKQRIAIARAILSNQKILIIDEGTSAQDSISESVVQNTLKSMKHNPTMLIIAQRLSTITHADKIVVLGKGRVVEQGTHKELVEKKGVYFALYDAQKKALENELK